MAVASKKEIKFAAEEPKFLSGSFLVILFVIKKALFFRLYALFLFLLATIFAVIPVVDTLAPVDAVTVLV